MALKFTDGGTKTNDPTQIYAIRVGTPAYTAAKGAFGVTALDLAQSVTAGVQLSQMVTFWANFWWSCSVLPASTEILYQVFDSVGNAAQLSLILTPSGGIQLFRGTNAGTLLATSSTSLAANVQYHFEVKATIDPTTGVFELRLMGNATPIATFTGNTRNTANTFADQVRWSTPSSNMHNYISHISVYDSTGSAPNGYIGVKRIYTQMPTADSATGGLNAFATTPSQSAGSHFNNIKETPPDDDTSYNADGTISDRESYQVAGLSASVGNITVVNVFARMRIDDAGPHTVNIVARNGATDTLGAAQSLAANYLYYNQAFPLDPNTGSSWTASGFGIGGNSTAEFGVEVAS